ncbi:MULTISPECIES: trp operon leader peptide [Escherichia]|nr:MULTISPECIES: trp operon leader peptide [Escherichia]
MKSIFVLKGWWRTS